MSVNFNRTHYLYCMQLNIRTFFSEKGSVGFTRISKGLCYEKLRTPAPVVGTCTAMFNVKVFEKYPHHICMCVFHKNLVKHRHYFLKQHSPILSTTRSVQFFFLMGKGANPLLRAGSRTAHVKITINGNLTT